MGSLRFVLSRRWFLFALVVVMLAYAAWLLGQWQFHRLDERKSTNQIVRANEDIAPTPVAEVLSPGRAPATSDEWRVVSATGTYDTEDTVVVRYRTREGESGIDVVVPLVTADGAALLVDRGWLAADARSTGLQDVPAPPVGVVTVTGWVRLDGVGDSTLVTDRSTRAISSDRIGDALDRELYGGFVDLRSESPEPEVSLLPVELPELDNGPHFFYGLQWWFFGVLAIFGFFFLLWDEWRNGPRGEREARTRQLLSGPHSERSIPPSTGSIAPEMKDAAGESRKAAARPNSAGTP